MMRLPSSNVKKIGHTKSSVDQESFDILQHLQDCIFAALPIKITWKWVKGQQDDIMPSIELWIGGPVPSLPIPMLTILPRISSI